MIKTGILLGLFFLVLFGNLVESYCSSNLTNVMLDRQNINGLEFISAFDFPGISSLSTIGDSFSDFSALVLLLEATVILLIVLQWLKSSFLLNFMATAGIVGCMYIAVIFTNYDRYYAEQCSARFNNFTFDTETPAHANLFFLLIVLLIYSWVDYILAYFRERKMKKPNPWSAELIDD